MFKLDYIPRYSLADMERFINNNNNFFLFGADCTGVSLRKWLQKRGNEVQGFIDNDKKKVDTELDGLNVININKLNLVKNPKIIISSIHSHEISKQLDNMGYKIFVDYIPFDNYGWVSIEKFSNSIGKSFYDEFKKFFNNYEKVLAILADEESKDIYSRVVNYRLTALDPLERGEENLPFPLDKYRKNASRYRDNIKSIKSKLALKYSNSITELLSHTLTLQPYEYKSLISNSNMNVIIDAGGFIGDTAMAFAYSSPNGLVYSFEPSESCYKEIKDLTQIFPNIIPVKAGLWDENKIVKLSTIEDQPNASFLNDEGTDVQVLKLDTYVEQFGIDKVDFIKMDIEGAEYNALNGAIQTIKRDLPDLAICIYHSPKDLWRIPLWIKENFPDYNIYIDHKDGMFVWGTVCFATVR